MALPPINPTNITPPRVEFIDPRSGAISREWYRFFLSLRNATQDNQEESATAPDTASLLATYDAMLASVEQASAITSDGMVASLESSLNSLQNAFGVTPPDLGGTVTSVAASGGATGLTFTGSPITTSGTLTLGGTLGVGYGGTGQTSYTDGQLLIGNSTGNTLTKATLIAGTNITITNGAGSITITSTAGTGTVTSVSVVSANGFAGTVANPTTTPAITLSTSVTGLIKGNGTALSAAVAATDYVAPSAYASANGLTMATSRLLGRTTASTGAAEEISVAGGLTLSAGVLTGASGTVTSVTGTSPVVSSGGTTPAISMPAATTSVNGYLTSTDWTTFNGKQATLVSGTNIKTVGGVSLLGSGDAGTIGVGYGGTGTATAFTAGSVVFAGTSGVYSQNNTNFFWDNTNSRLGVGTASPASKLDIGSGDLRFSGTGQRILGDMSNATITSRFAFQTTTVNGSTNVHIIPNGTSVIAGLKVESDSAVTTGQVMAIDMVGGTDARISSGIRGAGAYVPLTFYTSAAERMRIDTSGNVGVGTVSPSTYGKMAVSGNVANEASALGVADASTVSIINLADSALNQKASLVLRSNPNSRAAIAGYYAAFNGAGDTATGLIFGTQATAAGGVLERMRIDQNGNVGIGATANASALLDVQSTTKGFRLPNMTTAQKNAISSPAAGLMVFDTTLSKACVYSGAAWQTITSI